MLQYSMTCFHLLYPECLPLCHEEEAVNFRDILRGVFLAVVQPPPDPVLFLLLDVPARPVDEALADILLHGSAPSLSWTQTADTPKAGSQSLQRNVPPCDLSLALGTHLTWPKWWHNAITSYCLPTFMSCLCLQVLQRLWPSLHWYISVGGPISSWQKGHSSSLRMRCSRIGNPGSSSFTE